jgi:hypothetical protein
MTGVEMQHCPEEISHIEFVPAGNTGTEWEEVDTNPHGKQLLR